MTSSFESALGDELAQAARRVRTRRPRRRRVAVAVAGIGAVAAGVALFVSPQPASADVRITRENGRIEVLLTDLESRPDEVEEALRAEGLDVNVEEVPTGPSSWGRFVSVVASDSDVVDVRDQSQPGAGFLGFSVPEDWTGTLDIGLGRRAEAGEGYLAFTDAFGDGEPLECTHVRGETLGAAVDELEGLEVSVQPVVDGMLLPLVPLAEALDSEHRDWVVTEGTSLGVDNVVLAVGDVPPTEGSDPSC